MNWNLIDVIVVVYVVIIVGMNNLVFIKGGSGYLLSDLL